MNPIRLPVPPSANRYWRIYRNRAVKSEGARMYVQIVRGIWTREGLPLHEGPVGVAMTWHRKAKRGDLDNRLKVLLDALQGVAYANDSQIECIVAQVKDGAARAEVEVIVEPVGIIRPDPAA